MLPSWMRSARSSRPLAYFFAIEITRRRFASSISCFARDISRSPARAAPAAARSSAIGMPASSARRCSRSRISRMRAVAACARLFEAPQKLRPALGIQVLPQEAFTLQAGALGKAQQLAIKPHEPLAQAAENLHELPDPVLRQTHAGHRGGRLRMSARQARPGPLLRLDLGEIAPGCFRFFEALKHLSQQARLGQARGLDAGATILHRRLVIGRRTAIVGLRLLIP